MAHASSEGNCSVKGKGVQTSLNTVERRGRGSDIGRTEGREGLTWHIDRWLLAPSLTDIPSESSGENEQRMSKEIGSKVTT